MKKFKLIFILVISFIIFGLFTYSAHVKDIKDIKDRENAAEILRKQDENMKFTLDMIYAMDEIHEAEEIIDDFSGIDLFQIYTIREKYINSRRYLEKWINIDDEIKNKTVEELNLALDYFDAFVNSWIMGIEDNDASKIKLGAVKIKEGRSSVMSAAGALVLQDGGLEYSAEGKEVILKVISNLEWFNEIDNNRIKYIQDGGDYREFEAESEYFGLIMLRNKLLN